MLASTALLQSAIEKVAGISQKRCVALDAYRGFVMLVLVSAGLGFRYVTGNPACQTIATWFQHVPWEGAGLWDLVAPAFLFVVGASMPFALARRMEEGAAFPRLLVHVSSRALRLLLLSQFIMCIEANRLHLQFTNILAVIAFSYFFCFLIMQLKFQWQAAAAAAILAVHVALYAIFPGPDGPYSKNGNIGAGIEYALLHYVNQGSYSTLNILTSIVTTLFGVWTGMLLRSRRTDRQRLKIMAAASVVCFAAGLLLSVAGVPIVKRLWTASWTLYSAGWALLMMLAFYWVVEVRGFRKWAFPLIVLGMNSVFIYTVNEILRGWINKSLAVFTGWFKFLGAAGPVAQSCTTLLVMWSLCYWLYRRKIFFKV